MAYNKARSQAFGGAPDAGLVALHILGIIHLMIESVIISSSSVAPEIVPIGVRILVCLRFHAPLVVVKIIFDASIRSVFVVGARIEPIRLKLSGVIGFVSIRDVMVVHINKIVAGCIIHNFVESILNIVGRVGVDIVVRELKTIFNENSCLSADVASSSNMSSTGASGIHLNSGTPPLIKG